MEDEARAFPPLLRKDVAPWLKSCEEKQLQVPRLPLVARNDNLLRIESGFESCEICVDGLLPLVGGGFVGGGEGGDVVIAFGC